LPQENGTTAKQANSDHSHLYSSTTKGEGEEKNWKGRSHCSKNQYFPEDKLTHLQQKKKRMLEKLERITSLPENEKERLNRKLSWITNKLETLSSQEKK